MVPDSDVGIRDTEYILGGSRHQLIIGVTYVSQPGLGQFLISELVKDCYCFQSLLLLPGKNF